mmetsp:Transcript_24906/g.76899  ORF Transcript_24906/g.76899 Transcript_24906/m.76899 type:complete len:102 (+) Transcript_24906:82-387(+)
MLMCVVPGVCGIGIFSPRLDENGNSTRGVEVAAAMSKELGLHVLRKERRGSKSRVGSGKLSAAAMLRKQVSGFKKANKKITPMQMAVDRASRELRAAEPTN